MKHKKSLIRRLIPLLAVVIVVGAALAAVPTLARYIRGTRDVQNDFVSKGSVDPTVIWTKSEEDGMLKLQNVYFNVGETDYPVFVRVKILITWKAEDGSVLYLQPVKGSKTIISREEEDRQVIKEGDYAIAYADSGWKQIGDYWYYTEGVVSKENTPTLVTYFEQLSEEPPIYREKYVMDVEFIVQTVQAVGRTDEDKDGEEIPAWEDAWKPYLNTESEGDSGDTTGTEGGSEQDPDSGTEME